MSARGVQIGPLDPKTKKMRAEKWCRIPPELIQTEPGGASYGRKPFSGKSCDLGRAVGAFWVAKGGALGSCAAPIGSQEVPNRVEIGALGVYFMGPVDPADFDDSIVRNAGFRCPEEVEIEPQADFGADPCQGES